jgi:DNA-binding MarR family transcriptional regulator
LYGVELEPKWFTVFYVLSSAQAKTITAIAKEIGQSHPSVSAIVRKMVKKGLVLEKKTKPMGGVT